MTNRVQTIRSSVTGNRPSNRPPGELYVNWADNQLGVITPTQAAQDLVAVRYFSQSALYAVGDHVVQNGFIYRAIVAMTPGPFNPAQWQQVFSGNYLALTGGTMTGPLILAADPTVAFQAATKNYVDNHIATGFLPLTGGTLTGALTLASDPSTPLNAATKHYVDSLVAGPTNGYGENRILNGDMRIDQRNQGNQGTAQGYTVDRWYFTNNTTGVKGFWSQLTEQGGVATAGFPYCFGFSASPAYTPAAGDTIHFSQPIEADAIYDFCWGASNAVPATLQFWASATAAGLYGGAIATQFGTRSYPFSFTLPANTWTKVSITIPADTAGGWQLYGNGVGAVLYFGLGVGSTFRGPAGAWASADYRTANGTINVTATNGGGFFFTGVKLEVGSVATPFNRPPLAQALAACQRYYEQYNGTQVIGTGLYLTTTFFSGFIPFKVKKRIVPLLWSDTGTTYGSMNLIGPIAGAVTAYQFNSANIGPDTCQLNATVTGATAGQPAMIQVNSGHWFNADAEFY